MKPEQRAALTARIAVAEVATLNEAEAADALNAPGSGSGTTWQDVPTALVYRRLLIDGAPGAGGVSAWGLLELNSRRAPSTAFTTAASAPNAQDQIVAHMATLVRWVQSFPTIEATDPDVRARFAAILGALVTGGWISAATRDAVIALAQRPASWAEENGFPRGVTARDVGLARGAK
jgi:hypothetical protein